MKPAGHHIDALTSLRFFAALLVVLFHHGQAQFVQAPDWLQNIVKGGYVGVPFFFILSGFILAHTYRSQIETGRFRLRAFWLARFARVYPVYLLSLMVAAPFFWGEMFGRGPDVSASTAAINGLAVLGLVQSWIPVWAFSWNGPAWSLSVEAFFYAVFPLVLLAGPRTRAKGLVALSVAGVLVLAVSRLGPSWNAIAFLQRSLGWANPLLWLPLFLAGICAADARHALSRWSEGEAGRCKLVGWAGLTTMLAIGVLMALNLQRISQLLYCYAIAPFCLLLILLLAWDRHWFARWMSGRLLVLLGEASYSLYILHRPLHDWYVRMENAGWLPASDSWIGFSFYLTGCLVVSVLSLKLVEYPCREWLRQKLDFGRSGWAVRRGEALSPAAGGQ